MQVSLKQILQWVLPFCILVLIAWLCVFQVADTDFWWHVKAGQIMRETGSIIRTDPFAYTRVGQPYLAIHEWFAQIILSLVFDAGGATGIIFLRTILILTTCGLLLTIDLRRAWINALVLGFAAASVRHAIADRPQLFTFLLFVSVLVLCLRYLQMESGRRRKRLLLFVPVLILLWANIHGAAALVGVGLLGCVVIQKLIEYAALPSERSFTRLRELSWLGGVLFLCLVALLCTPSGIHAISYLVSLQSDRTVEFIREWQPSTLAIYFSRTWYLWVLAVISVVVVRKDFFFSMLVLLSMGYLSRTAVRHEPLFVFAALALIFHQLRNAPKWHAFLEHMLASQKLLSTLCILGILNAGIFQVYRTGYDANREHQSYGMGTFEPAQYAYDFLEREAINGPIFHNYDIGGYLLYRGAPERKVFLDGRNVDYGYDYIRKAVDADLNTTLWQELENEYQFTHALLYYRPQLIHDPIPYVDHLSANPTWALVYLDDWTAVYVKRIPENQSTIDRFGYTIITPKTLATHTVATEIQLSTLQHMQRELLRIIDSNPEGVQGILYLARLSIMLQQYQAAESLLEEAMQRQPKNFQIYELLSVLFMEQEDWVRAEEYINTAVRYAGFSHTNIDQAFVEMIRKNAAAVQ